MMKQSVPWDSGKGQAPPHEVGDAMQQIRAAEALSARERGIGRWRMLRHDIGLSVVEAEKWICSSRRGKSAAAIGATRAALANDRLTSRPFSLSLYA